MDLKTWLDNTMEGGSKIDRYEQFADTLGVSVHTVYKWVNGSRRIKDRYKLRINDLTDGAVTLVDMIRN